MENFPKKLEFSNLSDETFSSQNSSRVAMSKNDSVLLSNSRSKSKFNASTAHTISKLHELSDEEEDNNQPNRENQQQELLELEESVQSSDNETEYIENININFFQIRNKTLVKNVMQTMNSSKSFVPSHRAANGVNRIEQSSTSSSSVTWEISPKKRSSAAVAQMNRQPLLKYFFLLVQQNF